MSAKKTKKPPPSDPMVDLNVRVPKSYKEWLIQRAQSRGPGFLLSDEVRMIITAEKDREEARTR